MTASEEMKVKVGARGTIVIPKRLREEMRVNEGDILDLEARKEVILLRKDTLWERFKGSAKGRITAEQAEKELDVDEGKWEKRLQR